MGENLDGQHACAFVKGGANCNDYLFNFNRSEIDRVIRDANINQPLALVLHARFPHTSAFIADCGSVEEQMPPSSHFPS